MKQFILEVNTPIGAGVTVLFILVTHVAAQIPTTAPTPFTGEVPTATPSSSTGVSASASASLLSPGTTTVTMNAAATIPNQTTYIIVAPTALSSNSDISGSIAGSIVGCLIFVTLFALVAFLVRRYINKKERSKAIATPGRDNMSNDYENNYNISNLGATNDELSKDPYENKSLSVPEEILIPAPGNEHISNYNSQQETTHKPDDKSSNSEIIQTLRQEIMKDLRKEMMQNVRHDSLNYDVTGQNTSFGVDKEIVDQIKQDIIQDIKQEFKQNLRKEVTSSFTSEGISIGRSSSNNNK